MLGKVLTDSQALSASALPPDFVTIAAQHVAACAHTSPLATEPLPPVAPFDASSSFEENSSAAERAMKYAAPAPIALKTRSPPQPSATKSPTLLFFFGGGACPGAG